MNKAIGVFCSTFGLVAALAAFPLVALAVDLRQAPAQNIRSGNSNSSGSYNSYGQHPNNPDPSQRDLEELHRVNAQRQGVYKGLNQINPLSTDFGNATGSSQGQLPEVFQKIMANPKVKAMMQLSLDKNFQKNLLTVIDHPGRKTLLYLELGWVFFMIFFRSWRFSKCDLWYEKVWTSTWTMSILLFGTSIVLPYIVYGDPYLKMISAVLEIIF